jgi:hypothetical protein
LPARTPNVPSTAAYAWNLLPISIALGVWV